MSEAAVVEVIEAQPRSLEAIQAEYQQLCTQAGDLQYRIECFKEDLALINKRQKEVNQEGAAVIQAKAASEKAKENN